ncbi:hypothetical protein UVI_02002100 [Ustilaginoidea virens]|uniref:Uncharacterized protein n=1 Tax=Ustilaginoidea virens TaxID=1159556 RepID=A0A1B5L588_USTVR|nr:hypothetical protein UVI_02002100 [Ustilaginoidea virens]
MAAPAAPPAAAPAPTPVDAVLRNALRYTISAREYATLHRYVLSRSRALRRAAPSPASVDKALQPRPRPHPRSPPPPDDYNARAVRHALRVFAATLAAVRGWEALARRLPGGRPSSSKGGGVAGVRLSASLSCILLLYRLLFRFLCRLRAHLLDPQVEPFRRRNPHTAAALTSRYAPAVGASLAGAALGVYPARQLRVSVAVYALFRALEFAWNAGEAAGAVWGVRNGRRRDRPWWFGSWMLQPFAFGQLLHAVAFDGDCFPDTYGSFIFRHSDGYLHPRPPGLSPRVAWPSSADVVRSLAQMARLNWPPYVSPTMFPGAGAGAPAAAALPAVAPLTAQAHPLIASLSCAALHPADPSCLRAYLAFWPASFPPLARALLALHAALAVLPPRLPALYHRPLAVARRAVARALRSAAFAAGAISTAWASLCLFQAVLPRRALATQRFFLGGFLAGLWAWVDRRHGRPVFLHSARASVDCLWKVGVKRRWWRAMRAGDVWLFVAALMVTGVVYERDARAVREAEWRKGLSWIRGEGWRDWSVDDDDDDDDDDGDGEDGEDGADGNDVKDE